MSKLLTVPYKLQQGTDFQLAIPLINNNFEAAGAEFSGFTVNSQPGNGTGTGVPPEGSSGYVQYFWATIFTNALNDSPLVIQPTVSIFIDYSLDKRGQPIFSPADLWPTGSNMTLEKLSIVVGVHTSINTNNPTTDISYIDNGVSYYPYNTVWIAIRNGGAVTHSYIVGISASVYSGNTSQFR